MAPYFRFIFIFLFAFSAFAQKTDIANYDIQAKLNPETKTIIGEETITWTNTTNTPTQELQFHLYLNAFRDENSTFMKESGGQLRGDKIDTTSRKNYGNIYLSSIRIGQSSNLVSKIRYIQPDDLNSKDRTVISLALEKPILPGQTIQVQIGFKSLLPKIFARTGWANNDYFMVGQWFPKIGVFESKNNQTAQWNCHQFHAHSEFYADFGTYRVNINIPKEFKVAATGALKSETNNKDKTKNLFFEATKVHDFAFAASPHFKVFKTSHLGTSIQAFMQPEHAYQVERYFSSVKNAMDYMAKNVGAYPHKTLSLIDPSLSGSGSGGMEYPTLITCGSYWGIGQWGKYAEVVTIHEFVHQYFQGILASNEFEESWMDEGFTQFHEGKIMDTYYPDGSTLNLFGFTMNDLATSRMAYVSMDNPSITEINRKSWQYPGGTYGIMTYQKTATWLKNLEGLLGEKTFKSVIKTYFDTYKFRHPNMQNFVNVTNEVVQKEGKYESMDWFFQQAVYSAPTCDYAITKLKNAARKLTPSGNFTIERLGDMTLPVEIKVVFDDNKSETIYWDGKERIKEYAFKKRIKYAQIDPSYKNYLDMNMINNSYSSKSSTAVAAKYGTKMIFWAQQVFFSLFGLV
jgi:hypothetical protein